MIVDQLVRSYLEYSYTRQFLSLCRHWSEVCFEPELMTGTLDAGKNPLSRITLGTLEDMGYAVDYDNADAFGTADLAPSCVCNRRNLRDEFHGEVRPLDSNRPVKRQLSEDLRKEAIDYGLSILNENAAKEEAVNEDAANIFLPQRGGAIYVGHLIMSVLMREEDTFFGVLVVRESSKW